MTSCPRQPVLGHRLATTGLVAFVLATAVWPRAAGAQGHAGHGTPAAAAPTAQAAQTPPAAPGWTDGEVRKVDAEAGKLTLRHATIRHLDMPPMTMVFGVRDKAMLAGLKAGDKLRFIAVDEGGGKLVVTELQPLK